MKVLLKKEGYFEFDETKFTKIPSDVFNAMATTTFENVEKVDSNIPEVLYFKNMKDYITHASSGKYIFDKTKDVFVSQKGEIFVYLNSVIKSGSVIVDNKGLSSTITAKDIKSNATTNSEKDSTGKA